VGCVVPLLIQEVTSAAGFFVPSALPGVGDLRIIIFDLSRGGDRRRQIICR